MTVNELHISVPAIPVGFNHYVRHTRAGHHYVTPEAESFKNLVALAVRQGASQCVADEFELEINILLGKGQKLDVDNSCKIVADALQEVGAFMNFKGKQLTDSHVTRLVVTKSRSENGNPETRISVRARGV